MNTDRYCKHQGGFSLLEILVAFSILAVSLGVILNIFSRGLQGAIVSEEYIHAVAIAESLLARTGIETALQEQIISGEEENKYQWNVQVNPYNDELLPDPQQSGIDTFQVTVQVEWGREKDRRAVELTTLRMVNNK